MRSVLILPCWKTEVADGAGQSPPLRSGGGGAAQSAVTEGASPLAVGAQALATPPSPGFAWSPPPASQGEIRLGGACNPAGKEHQGGARAPL